jgi:predicted permease
MRDENPGTERGADDARGVASSNVDWRAAARASLAARAMDPAAEAELVEELAQHLEDEFAALISRGTPADDARRQLLAQLSAEPLGRALERRAPYREAHTPGVPARGAWLQTLWQDFQYGGRALVRTPAVSIVAVLSFALTIGANTAVFGLLDTVLLEPLHVPHPEQLFVMQRTFDDPRVSMRIASAQDRPLLSAANYEIVKQAPGLSDLQAYTIYPANISTGTEAVPHAWIDVVSGGFFTLLGVPAALGRSFAASDLDAREPVAMVSYEFWRQHLHADREAIGRVIHVNNSSVTIIGVTGRNYHGLYFGRDFDVAVPFASTAALGLPSNPVMGVMFVARADGTAARLAATTAVDAVLRRCCAEFTADGGTKEGLLVTPVGITRGLTWHKMRADYRRVLVVLMGGVLVLLVLGCANVTTLLIARGTAREQEFAIRASLGASRRRIARQLLVESFELTACGTLLGLGFARAGTQLLAHALPAAASALADQVPIHASGTLLLFTTSVVVACTLVCGLLPAIRVSRGDFRASLTGTSAQSRSIRGALLDRVLVSGQVALALVVVSTALLFVATLRSFQDFDFGYKDDRILLAAFTAPELDGKPDPILALSSRLLANVRDVPGVDRAAIASVTPLFGHSRNWTPIGLEGKPAPKHGPMTTEFALVTPDYFRATGISLVRGRGFTASDSVPAAPVAIVSQTFARRYFGTSDAVGRRFRFGWRGLYPDAWMRIVGIARDAYYPRMEGGMAKDVSHPTEIFYIPLSQTLAAGFKHPNMELEMVVRTAGDPRGFENTFRRAVAAVPNAELTRLSSVTQVLDNSIPRERFSATVGMLFAIIALSLAAAGFFAVVAYAVARRTREIGIRIALGARPADALWLMIREMLVLTVIGSILGVVLGHVAANAVRSQLYGISATDPRVPLAAALLLLLVGLVASALPARRAVRVDPLIALRSE